MSYPGTAAALANYEQTVVLAPEETENALVQLARERERRDQLRISAEATERATARARERYRYGARTSARSVPSRRAEHAPPVPMRRMVLRRAGR